VSNVGKLIIEKQFLSLTSYSLFYQAGSGPRLSKEKLLRYLLEGTAAASNGEGIGDEEKDAVDNLKQNQSMLLLKFFLTLYTIHVWFICLHDSISLL
jgi:hypothetical protein